MASRMRVRCCRTASAVAVAVLLSVAHAEPIPDLDGARPPAHHLYLQVRLNEVDAAGLVPFERIDGHLHATVDALRALGFALDGHDSGERIAVHTLPGVHVRYDPARQSVQIDAPLDVLALPATTLGLTQQDAAVVTDYSPGLLMNYDLYASEGSGAWNATGAGELRVFGLGRAVLSTTGVVRAYQAESGHRQHESVRLDTRVQWAFPATAVSVVAGDTFTGFLDWTRPVRIGGLQIGRNFALQPYRTTMPLPEFLGEAVVPSDVELYVNGLRQYSGSTPPGPFQLAPVPGVTGAGNARVVVTDAYGRVNTLDFPFYATQRLLARGLSDWSLGLGRVRERYGVASFEYADAFVASGSLRYGASNRLTLETHAEHADGLNVAGAGALWTPAMAGVFNVAHARSRHHHGQGSQTVLGWSWNDSRYQLAIDTRRTRGDYRDVAALYGSPPPSRSDRVVAGFSTDAGNFGLSYVRLDQPAWTPDPDAPPVAAMRNRFAGLYWSHAFANGWFANASINQGFDADRDRSAYIGLMIPLGRQGERQAALSWQHDAGGDGVVADLLQPVPGDGGRGWRLQARAGGLSGGLAEGAWLGPYGRIGGGVSQLGDARFSYAQASGSVVGMGGGWFAARAVTDAFAVVSTDGHPDVPVALENRFIGSTDARGLLMVTPLNAWQHNRLSIDPMDLPADIRVTDAARLATPAAGAGVRVDFEVRRVRAMRLHLHDVDGRPLPAGSRIEGAPPGVAGLVGHGGEVYIEDLWQATALRVRTPDGAHCVADMPATTLEHGVDLRPTSLLCNPVTAP